MKEVHETLKQTHQSLQNEMTKEKTGMVETIQARDERISRIQGELDRVSKELALEKNKTEDLLETIDRLQNDTTQLDSLRSVISSQEEELNQQKRTYESTLQEKVEILKSLEDDKSELSRDLKGLLLFIISSSSYILMSLYK